MKPCKIYSTRKNAEADAVIMEGRVLVPSVRRKGIEPAFTDHNGQPYYAPFDAVDFADGMNFDLMPFSVECDWGEYGEADSPIHNWVQCYDDKINFPVKWGYCDTKTGAIRIAPEMEQCRDFNEYGAAIMDFYESLYAY
jgi:hypothetical protein